MNIVSLVGARPNLVKIEPLLREMRAHPEVQPILVHTGQHYSAGLSEGFFLQMEIPEPNVNLGVGSGSSTWQTAEIMRRLEPCLLELHPDLLLVVGDVNSTLAGALTASRLGIPVAHVEAGLRSFDRSMPEEINRILTDTLADYLFATEQDAVENLLHEGHPGQNIHLVGNVMIDTLRHFLPLARKSRIGYELGLVDETGARPFAVLTLHRPSNVDSPVVLRNILQTINAVASLLPVVFPIHPRTESKLHGLGVQYHPHFRFFAPMGYLDFLCLLSYATVVLTDSGGIQEETTALRVPCLTLRKATERPVTVREGTNQIVGQAPGTILAAVGDVLAGRHNLGRLPALWDGHASKRIVDVLLSKKSTSTT
jgi:UDP-N-acetylglucosamine 2-epimerase (non-hydrolysing)